MNFFRSFFRTSVDRILSSITKHIEALKANAAAEAVRKEQKQDEIEKLADQVTNHHDENQRALAVAAKLENLIS